MVGPDSRIGGRVLRQSRFPGPQFKMPYFSGVDPAVYVYLLRTAANSVTQAILRRLVEKSQGSVMSLEYVTGTEFILANDSI